MFNGVDEDEFSTLMGVGAPFAAFYDWKGMTRPDAFIVQDLIAERPQDFRGALKEILLAAQKSGNETIRFHPVQDSIFGGPGMANIATRLGAVNKGLYYDLPTQNLDDFLSGRMSAMKAERRTPAPAAVPEDIRKVIIDQLAGKTYNPKDVGRELPELHPRFRQVYGSPQDLAYFGVPPGPRIWGPQQNPPWATQTGWPKAVPKTIADYSIPPGETVEEFRTLRGIKNRLGLPMNPTVEAIEQLSNTPRPRPIDYSMERYLGRKAVEESKMKEVISNLLKSIFKRIR